jgi:dTMP kinase
MFICLEGIDASGKATQSRFLATHLGARLYSFPDYSTPMGKLIEGHLHQYWAAQPSTGGGKYWPEPQTLQTLDALVFQALQLANRMEHASAIQQAKAQGLHVVADRYWPSGWVYGAADGLSPDYLRAIHEHLPQPDLFILLEIDPDVSVQRRPDRRDRYEKQPGLMRRAVQLYTQLWAAQIAKMDMRWCVIDAGRPFGEVSASILYEVRARMGVPCE